MQRSARDGHIFAVLVDKHAGRRGVGDRAVASCAPSHSLQQVKTSNPSVTYEYRGDQELLQAQQNAVTFCNQYGSAPRPARAFGRAALLRTAIAPGPGTVARGREPVPPLGARQSVRERAVIPEDQNTKNGVDYR
jgi:hypothetical protein